jgi:hypothetical protein
VQGGAAPQSLAQVEALEKQMTDALAEIRRAEGSAEEEGLSARPRRGGCARAQPPRRTVRARSGFHAITLRCTVRGGALRANPRYELVPLERIASAQLEQR